MAKTLEQRISDLEKSSNNNGTFNNLNSLMDFKSPVKFRQPSIYPKDNTVIDTTTIKSTGRIKIILGDGTVAYIPYY